MARLPKHELIHRVQVALRAGGWNVLSLTAPTVHPARLRLFREGDAEIVRVYIWNVSHGGGANRPQHEFRVQITGVADLEAEPGGKTLLLGWDNDLEVLAAFDITRHAGPVAASPSIQIGRAALESAAQNGLAPYNRGNGEIAFGVRPDYLAIYLSQMSGLHGAGAVGAEITLLERLVDNPDSVEDDEIEATVGGARRRALLTTWRMLRDRKFRKKVLGAYQHRCAMCDLQMGLLEAAHILPVGHPNSTDKTKNGVALCALHHRAYDLSLVTFDESFDIFINEPKIVALAAEDRAGGEPEFRAALRPQLALPALNHRPRPANVREANRFRGWL